jgi:hypothetical protein
VERHGDPCRECGFDWSIDPEEAQARMAELPSALAGALAAATGAEQHPDLGWSVTGYVCHITDNLRVWAERLAGAALGGTADVGLYDADVMADARGYGSVSLPGALWSLRRATDDWLDAVSLAAGAGVVLRHPQRGPLCVEDVIRSNTHDASHHVWDVRRSL